MFLIIGTSQYHEGWQQQHDKTCILCVMLAVWRFRIFFTCVEENYEIINNWWCLRQQFCFVSAKEQMSVSQDIDKYINKKNGMKFFDL